MVLLALCAFVLAASAQTSYVVKAGDTLWGISKKHGTTPQAIAEANHIPNPSLIVIGRSLVIPGGAPTAAPQMKPVAHTQQWTGKHVVAKGENLTQIAARYGVSVSDLAKVNSLKNASLIRLGQTLAVPGPPPKRELTVEELLVHYGKEFGVDPALVKAIAWQESGWKQKVVSSAGAIGVMQVIPETGAFTGQRLLGGLQIDLNNMDDNVKAGVRFLAFLLAQTNGDEKLAVAGYFQGLRSVRTIGITPKTERYVANVMALKKRFSR